MASYIRELEREGSLPPLRSTGVYVHESRRVNFEDERHRARSPNGVYHRAESPHFQPRPPSPGARRHHVELQDQIRSCREECQRKDELIQQLVSMENAVASAPIRSTVETVKIEQMCLGDRQSLDAARSELAALQVRSEKQQQKIRELENELEVREVKIREVQLQMETGRENERRLQCLIDSLRSSVTELEGRAGAFESVAGRSEFTVAALQKESKSSQERIVELEARQRKILEEREDAQARVEALDRKITELLSQFSAALHIEGMTGGVCNSDEILRKITDMYDENALLKGKVLTMSEVLNNSELESKASRETIARLVSEMTKEQQNQSRYINESNALRSERDVERAARKELELEIVTLRERVDSYMRNLDCNRKEVEARDARIAGLEHEIRTSSSSVHLASAQFAQFREKLASILGDCDAHRGEEYLLRKVESYLCKTKDYTYKYDSMEGRIHELTDQLRTECELHKVAASKVRQMEIEYSELVNRLQVAEGELATNDVLRDGFRGDKERYMRCIQQLGEAMKMDRISLDLGMDMTIDALIARAQQLVNYERDNNAERSSHVYNLQRKVKSLKEQLESKDLHIDLLRKKITSLEEKILNKSTIERERDAETLRIRKLEKMVEKYKIQLTDSRREVTNLKAELLGASELRVRTLEQRKETEELALTVSQLEELRRKQAHKIRNLKSEVNASTKESEESRVVADNAVQALTSELRTTKAALCALQSREKQLLDFRLVIARMLGLDINTLAIPDYEIISRLEKLIQAHHSHAFTTMSLEEALADMEDGFVTGYTEYVTGGTCESQNVIRSRERVKRKSLRSRARSLSPQRRIIGPKCY